MSGSYSMPYRIKGCFIGLLILLGTHAAAQDSVRVADHADAIAVIVRPSADSITLRWAPVSLFHWVTANRYGYHVERFTLVRNGKVLRPVERKALTSAPLKPLPEAGWEKFVNNKYGMVAAQALYGETFELNIAESDVTQIVNKAKENEQRFSIALFCADMSPAVANAQGLYWSDKQIEKNVKYLYRISVITPTDTLRGSVFIDPSQKYQLPGVTDVTGETAGNVVTLRWNQLEYASFYTTYSIERSEDGKTFTDITDIAGVTLSKKGAESKYQYAVDTLASLGKDYSYRIRGLTPFGEFGPISNVVKVKGNKVVESSVFITTALSSDNKSIDLEWEFPEADNDALAGFEVTRSAKSSGPYKTIHKDILPPAARVFKDTSPEQSNYYKLKAKTLDGTEIISMPFLALLVDSVPPVMPIGLKGKVDDFGNVRISWKPNPDLDIFGYRIYRAYYESEEFSLKTGEPLKDTVFTDKVELKSLNEKIHYRVMAIDRNQNHSTLSAILSLSLPDKVPPMPAVWLPVKSTKEGVVLRWTPSGSQDVVKYEVYRKGEQGQWIRLITKVAGTDTLYTYTDQNLQNSAVQYYTVVAVDEAGLESPPGPVMTGFRLTGPKPPVKVSTPAVDRVNKKIALNWSYEEQHVTSYRVYKKINDEALMLYRTVKEKNFTDSGMVPGTKYSYQVMAVFENGALSDMGKVIQLDF
jgi:fibronectin type 3 domain-containing protein